MKHTPAPWAIYFCEPGDRNGVIYSESLPEGSPNICEMSADVCIKSEDRRRGDKWIYSEQRAADARLIAAAPDLLEALEDLLSYLEGYDADYPESLPKFDRARAAITKAQGGQS